MVTLGVEPRGILHLGAGDGREVPEYRALGFRRIVLVEPLPWRAADLRRIAGGTEDAYGPTVVEAAIASVAGPALLNVIAHDEASSLLSPLVWDVLDRVTVATVPLADLDLEGLNVLVADVQGSEVDALSSGPLEGFELAIVEATEAARYAGGANQETLDAFFFERGWVPLASYPHHAEAWVVDTAYVPGFPD